jgi:hypothetical protein
MITGKKTRGTVTRSELHQLDRVSLVTCTREWDDWMSRFEIYFLHHRKIELSHLMKGRDKEHSRVDRSKSKRLS